MLTKEECLKALDILTKHECCCCDFEDDECLCQCALEQMLNQLIEEHFELQLTESECDLIEFALKPLEEELGWDVLLLIDKIRSCKYSLPKNNEYVKSIEEYVKSIKPEAFIVEEIDFTKKG